MGNIIHQDCLSLPSDRRHPQILGSKHIYKDRSLWLHQHCKSAFIDCKLGRTKVLACYMIHLFGMTIYTPADKYRQMLRAWII
jgi:hypothetical protein